jgi:hypothetical protein
MDFVRLVVNAVLTGGFIAIVTTANTFALVRLSPGSSGVSQTFTRPIFVAGGQIVRLTTTNQLAPTPLNYYIDLAGFY